MSTEFVHLVQISINKKTISQESLLKEKFRLNLVLNEWGIIVETLIKGKKERTDIKSKDGKYDLGKVYQKLIEIKYKFPKERNVTIAPKRDVKYKEIIKVIEKVRFIKKNDQKKMGLKFNYLFDQFTFND